MFLKNPFEWKNDFNKHPSKYWINQSCTNIYPYFSLNSKTGKHLGNGKHFDSWSPLKGLGCKTASANSQKSFLNEYFRIEWNLNPFSTNIPRLYPLKTSENLTFHENSELFLSINCFRKNSIIGLWPALNAPLFPVSIQLTNWLCHSTLLHFLYSNLSPSHFE